MNDVTQISSFLTPITLCLIYWCYKITPPIFVTSFLNVPKSFFLFVNCSSLLAMKYVKSIIAIMETPMKYESGWIDTPLSNNRTSSTNGFYLLEPTRHELLNLQIPIIVHLTWGTFIFMTSLDEKEWVLEWWHVLCELVKFVWHHLYNSCSLSQGFQTLI